MTIYGIKIDDVYLYYAGMATIILSLVLVVLYLLQRRRVKRNDIRLELASRMLQHIQPSAGLENNLNYILEMVGGFVSAPSYTFYLRNEKQQQLVLKATRYREGQAGVAGGSGRGGAKKEKEVYHPPLQLPIEAIGSRTELIKEGEVPLLSIPIMGGSGLVRVGPVTQLKSSQRWALEYISQLSSQFLSILIDSDRLQRKAEVIVTSGEALRKISSIALDCGETMSKVLGMAAVALELKAGFIALPDGGRLQTAASLGVSREALRSKEWPEALLQWLGGRKATVIGSDEVRPDWLPSSLSGQNGEGLVISQFDVFGEGGLLVFVPSSGSNERSSLSQLSASAVSIAANLSELIRIQMQTRQLSDSSAELLKSLSRSIDNLNPYTTGYSELMSRYSIIIAIEMGLPADQITDIGLAAYLSNIGMLGLSEELYLKEGQYSEQEFEKMKLHAEVGADIVEITLGNKAVADYIRHHHERMDGNGYPAGLKDQQIPVGARIIAVTQTFLAKIQGRKYREPLAFNKALALLKAAAGSQLDPAAVEALSSWFKRKQTNPALAGRSLGSCWEMCCVPKEICAGCPAFGKEDVNCWEVPGNHCQSHGKSCASCPVRSEAATRLA
ncbi:HD-GYP domain-containing protein [Paenibacillus cremeus]|uniref:HD-GYP domain-containing protein n=1 Tax=Paenibacillus cremeus TaxID=2163881 RepID=UPI001644FC92|nr:HD domain-containing phosphohydrolase [Paenibacillus cremeus]